jgi:hypothetical protein
MITSGELHCHGIMIIWLIKVTLGFLNLQAGAKAYFPLKSHPQCKCFRKSLRQLFTTASNTCSCEVIIPPGMSTQLMFMGQTVALFLVLNATKYIIKQPFFQEHFRCSIPHIWRPILPKFIGHRTFRLSSDKDSSRQLLLRHCYAIQNQKCRYFATNC